MKKGVLFLFVLAFVGYFFDPLLSYIIGAFAVVKSKLLSFIKLSVKKLWLYIKTLTIAKAVAVGVKRFIIDNYISKWIDTHILTPLKKPIKGYIKLFLALNLKEKIKKIFYALIPLILLLYLAAAADILSSVLFYAEIKAFVIAFFKFLWLFIDRVGGWLYNLFIASWMAPILQIFALAWVIEQIEKIPFIGRPIALFYQKLEALFSQAFRMVQWWWHRYIERHITVRTRRKIKKVAKYLELSLERLKFYNELWVMRQFARSYLRTKRLGAYFEQELKNFLQAHPNGTKREFYRFHNEQTRDNIDIIAFFDMKPLPSLEDVVLVESFATKQADGNEKIGFSKNAFWALNLSFMEVELTTDHKRYKIKPKRVKLIQMQEQDIDKLELFVDGEVLKACKL